VARAKAVGRGDERTPRGTAEALWRGRSDGEMRPEGSARSGAEAAARAAAAAAEAAARAAAAEAAQRDVAVSEGVGGKAKAVGRSDERTPRGQKLCDCVKSVSEMRPEGSAAKAKAVGRRRRARRRAHAQGDSRGSMARRLARAKAVRISSSTIRSRSSSTSSSSSSSAVWLRCVMGGCGCRFPVVGRSSLSRGRGKVRSGRSPRWW